MLLLYDAPNDAIQPGIQVVVPGTASSGVTVYFDGLVVRELPDLIFEDVSLDADGSFDADAADVMRNVNDNTGTPLLLPDPEGGNNFLLVISEPDDAANIGVFASRLQGGFPHVLEASVDARLLSGSGGVTALVMTNGNGNVGVFVNNGILPGVGDSPVRITIGGGFATENPVFPILCVGQNGGPGAASSVVIDNLELRRITAGL